jgi:hypothetical protein
MRYYEKGNLLISRYTKTTSAIFSMYHILGLLDKPSLMVYSNKEKKLITIDKKPSEIICVDFDFTELEGTFYKWFYQSNKFGNSSKPFLFLNADETKLFLKSINTALHYFTKQKYNCISENHLGELKDLYDAIIPEQIVN